MQRLEQLLIAVVALTLGGCSPWSSGGLDQSLLKSPRMSPDTVVLELALVEITDPEKLWPEVDEQHLPVDVRRRLEAHGIRAGVLGTEVPGWIKDCLARQQKTLQVDEESGTAVVGDERCQRTLQCRSGQARTVELGSPFPELDLDAPEGDLAFPLKDAQCQWCITARPLGDGRVRVEATPEICHGSPRHRWLGNDGSFRVDLARDRQRYDELSLAATLAPGQTLVLSAASEAQGLGRPFFVPEAAPDTRRVLMLRLAQTQFDDLFAPLPAFTPIATDAP